MTDSFLTIKGSDAIENMGLKDTKEGDEYNLIVTFSSVNEVKLNFKKIDK